ncbi:MAG: hypothetical protein A2076_17360 [Geobacteraceae bacterium GWC2_53_11]|nr:MAG: hypothetical protein A2076_17360 [Geobacteraceae bacterium GWC2_53_11]
MKFNSEIHHRKSIRLRGYDYSQAGLYFITICTHERLPLFGKIDDGKMVANDAGLMVEKCWREIPDHFPQVILDGFVVMPNHIHGIIEIRDTGVDVNNVGAKNVGANDYLPLRLHGTSRTVGSIVRGFKVGVTTWFREHTDIHQIWQRNYHEHIIRNEESYFKISEYIEYNPQKWLEDTYNV